MTREIKLGKKMIGDGQPARNLTGKFLGVLLVSLSLMAFVLAPAGYVFLLNHEQKQCGTMWLGDEYVYYAPPEPWQEAELDSNGMTQTQFGSCNIKEVIYNHSISYEDCCKNLGYTYIGEIKGVVEKRDYGLTFGLLIQLLIILIYRYWVLIAIFLVVVYLLRKQFKKKENEQKTTGEENGS